MPPHLDPDEWVGDGREAPRSFSALLRQKLSLDRNGTCVLYDANTGVAIVPEDFAMNPVSALGCFFRKIIRRHRDIECHHITVLFFFSFSLQFTYQVRHVLLWFGNVELHLVFNEELESQVVLGGVQLMGL